MKDTIICVYYYSGSFCQTVGFLVLERMKGGGKPWEPALALQGIAVWCDLGQVKFVFEVTYLMYQPHFLPHCRLETLSMYLGLALSLNLVSILLSSSPPALGFQACATVPNFTEV